MNNKLPSRANTFLPQARRITWKIWSCVKTSYIDYYILMTNEMKKHFKTKTNFQEQGSEKARLQNTLKSFYKIY